MDENIKPLQVVGYIITEDGDVQTECISISLKNKGTATVLLNESIPIEANEYFVFPHSIGYGYRKRLTIKFGDSGTKKLLVVKLIPE